MRRVLSWKRLVVVGGVLLVLGVGTYGVHGLQARRNADSLKEQAAKAVADGQTDQALTFYEKYLKFRPRDEDAVRKYVGLNFTVAQTDPARRPRAADLAEDFLRKFPNNPDERRQLVDLYMKGGRLNPARDHLKTLFNSGDGRFKIDPEVLGKAATCEIAAGNPAEAVAHLRTAIDTGKGTLAERVELYERTIALYWDNRDTMRDARSSANDLARTLIESEPFTSDIGARVVAARLRLADGDPANARKHIEHALTRMPGGATHPDALFAAAWLELAGLKGTADDPGRVEAARVHLSKAFEVSKSARTGMQLADVLIRQQKKDEAIRVLTQTADALGTPNDNYLLVVDQLLDIGNREQVEKYVEVIAKEKVGVMPAYYRGRLALLKGDWPEARDQLTRAATGLTAASLKDYRKKLEAGLGRAYQGLQNPDRQLGHHERALEIDPAYLLSLLGRADAYVHLGELPKALAQYRTLVSDKGFRRTAERATLVRLEFLAVRKLPPDEQTWKTFDEALGPPEQRTAEIVLLHVESLAARGDPKNAVALLDKLLDQTPDYAVAWLALGRIKYGGKSEPALAELDALGKKIGDSLDRRLARALLFVGRAAKPTAAEYRKLADGVEKFSAADHRRFWAGLGEAAVWAAGVQPDPKAAKDLRVAAIDFFRKVAALDPGDIASRAVLIDLGTTADRRDVVEEALADLARIEGPTGPIGSLGRVALELPTAAGNPEKIVELRAKAEKVIESRPGWGRAYVALAKLDELAGLNDRALDHYRTAIRKRDRQEAVIRRTVELLMIRKKDQEAARLLNDLYTEVPLPDDLERFRSIMNLLARDIPANERHTIDRIAPPLKKDQPPRRDEHKLQLLRGALLAAIEDARDPAVLQGWSAVAGATVVHAVQDPAEEAFRSALALVDTIPDTWTALVSYLAKRGKREEAEHVIALARRKLLDQPPADPTDRGKLTLALAGCYEVLGDPTSAGQRYHEAVALAPNDLTFNQQLVYFLQRTGRAAEADKVLGGLIGSPAPDLKRWARRHTALTLITRPEAYYNRKDAMGLIEENLRSGPKDSEDVKTRAWVLTVNPETRREGLETLRKFGDNGELTPEEFYWLARLYFDQGDVDVSVGYFRLAAQPLPGVTVEHLAGLVRVELARNQRERAYPLAPAERALERLKAAAPRSWETTRETARVTHRRSQLLTSPDPNARTAMAASTRDFVLAFPGARSPQYAVSRTAPLLEEIGFADEAEKLYRAAAADAKNPGAHLPLARFLIQNKRGREAIELGRLRESAAPVGVTASVLSGAVRSGTDPQTAAEVEHWLTTKVREYEGRPELAGLVASRAQVYDATARYKEAVAEYERAVKLDPVGASSLAVNNLCMLLALQQPERVSEAVGMMNHLIGIRGPNPIFLDTRAVCQLVAGGAYRDEAKNKTGPELALDDLSLALIQRQQPVYHFHRAWAFQLLGKQRDKDTALAEAKVGKLTRAALHPLELLKFSELYSSFPGGPPE